MARETFREVLGVIGATERPHAVLWIRMDDTQWWS